MIGDTAVTAPEGAVTETAVVETPAAEVVETPVENVEAPKEESKKDPASARFAALSRREKEIQQRDQQAKQREQEFERRKAEIESRAKELEEREKAAKSGRPLDRLKAMGLTPEEVNRDLLGGYQPPEEDPVDKKLQPLQQQLQEALKANEELRKKVQEVDNSAKLRQQQEDYLKFVDAVKKTVEDGGEKYEYVSLNGQEAIDIVQQTMLEYYQKNNKKLLSYDEACELVEDYYSEKAEKLSKAKKLQAKFASPAVTRQSEPAASTPKSEPKTLTADLTASAEATVDITKMSKREAQEYVAKMLKFNRED